MLSTISKITFFIFVLHYVIALQVNGRPTRYSSSEILVSDGTNDIQVDQASRLILKGILGSDEEKYCEQMYGFLPCSNSIFGHLFLILVYEYLLFHGESYLAAGGERIFKILGPGVFGASAFHVVGALPEALLLLASELLYSKEVAEEYVNTGVGLLAGSSILQLTLIWGTCVSAGSRVLPGVSETSNLSDASFFGNLSWERLLSSLSGFGVTTDMETSYIARIMVFSVAPFLIIQFLKLVPGYDDAVILIALTVSVLFLLFYFIFQIFQPWIQQRRLEYVKHEHLILRILKHVQKHALGRILTEDGAPNVDAIRRLFEEIDHDGDDIISPSELREVLLDVKFKRMHIDKEKAIAEVIKEFDLDADQKITKDEFVNGFTKWLDEAKNAIDKQYYSQKSLKDIYRIFQPWIQNKRKEREIKKNLISEVLEHVQRNAICSLLKEDGTPNLSEIRRLFEEIDRDGDNYISESELKDLLVHVRFGKVPLNADEAVAKLFEELDTSGDRMIDQEEFVAGIAKWLNNASTDEAPSKTETQDDIHLKSWEETDKLVDYEKSNGVDVDSSVWSWFKAIMQMVLGVLILSVLAEPLIDSVENFSKAANVPSFFISFVLVPLATNFRAATSAITAASRKKPRTTSLAFSEIYGGVFMNNILGFTVLLSLIYIRGLRWEYSAEVMVVVIVCAVMGVIASFRSTFPLWISYMAYVLYPLSLILVYLFNDGINYVYEQTKLRGI